MLLKNDSIKTSAPPQLTGEKLTDILKQDFRLSTVDNLPEFLSEFSIRCFFKKWLCLAKFVYGLWITLIEYCVFYLILAEKSQVLDNLFIHCSKLTND